jgi:hypothetical protein
MRYRLVLPIVGEPLRFHVVSRSQAGLRHLVDLEEFGGNGQCSCEDFQFRHQPLLERGAFAADHLRCWHIMEARWFLLNKLAEAIEADKPAPWLRVFVDLAVQAIADTRKDRKVLR